MRKLKNIIPGIKGSSVKDEQVSVNLPLGAEKFYADVLDVLNATGAPDVAMSLTSLEDVFLATSDEKEVGGSIEVNERPSALHREDSMWRSVGTTKPSKARKWTCFVSYVGVPQDPSSTWPEW